MGTISGAGNRLFRQTSAGVVFALGILAAGGCTTPPGPSQSPPASSEPLSTPPQGTSQPEILLRPPSAVSPILKGEPAPVVNPIDQLDLPVGRILVTGTKEIMWIPVSITREGEVKRESPEHLSLESMFDFWVPFYGDVRIDFHLDVRWYGTPNELDIDIRNGEVFRRYVRGVVEEEPGGVKRVRSKWGDEAFTFTPGEEGSTHLAVEGIPGMEGVDIEFRPVLPEPPIP